MPALLLLGDYFELLGAVCTLQYCELLGAGVQGYCEPDLYKHSASE